MLQTTFSLRTPEGAGATVASFVFTGREDGGPSVPPVLRAVCVPGRKERLEGA